MTKAVAMTDDLMQPCPSVIAYYTLESARPVLVCGCGPCTQPPNPIAYRVWGETVVSP